MFEFIKRAFGFNKPTRVTVPVKDFEPEPTPEVTSPPVVKATVTAAKKSKPRPAPMSPSSKPRTNRRNGATCDSQQSDYYTSRAYEPVIDASPISTTYYDSSPSYGSSCDSSSSSSDSGSSGGDSGGGGCD